MLCIERVAAIFHAERAEALGREVLRKRVHRAQANDKWFDRLRKRFVRRVHVRPKRIAAELRDLFSIEHRGLRRRFEEGDVVMPAVAVGTMRRIVC